MAGKGFERCGSWQGMALTPSSDCPLRGFHLFMSLLIACVTPEYIIVVADQRLREWFSPGKLGKITCCFGKRA